LTSLRVLGGHGCLGAQLLVGRRLGNLPHRPCRRYFAPGWLSLA
jgi:hypothetical protein